MRRHERCFAALTVPERFSVDFDAIARVTRACRASLQDEIVK